MAARRRCSCGNPAKFQIHTTVLCPDAAQRLTDGHILFTYLGFRGNQVEIPDLNQEVFTVDLKSLRLNKGDRDVRRSLQPPEA